MNIANLLDPIALGKDAAVVVWFIDGVAYHCAREAGACPFCARQTVVALPGPILTQQTDGTTHVCHPTIGGCNHGFADHRGAR